METWTSEIVQAVRRLARSPIHTLAVVLVVGTGVAFASAMSSLASAVLRQALPYPDAHELMRLDESNQEQGIEQMQSSLPGYGVWQERSRAFESLGVVGPPLNVTLESGGGPTRILGALVSPELLTTLGVEPILGRAFGAEEGAEGLASQSVVISHELWVDRYGAQPDILGQAMVINGSSWSVAGVLPHDTPLDPTRQERIDVWFALGHTRTILGRDAWNEPNYRSFVIIGRLNTALAERAIDEDLSAVRTELVARHPESHDGWSWARTPLIDVVTGQVRAPLITLAVTAVFLFLVCIANVGALLAQRARDAIPAASVRLALGADERTLWQWAMAELLVWSLPAVMGGLVAGAIALSYRNLWMPFPIPPHISVATDARLAAAILAGTIASTLLAGRITSSWWSRQSAFVTPRTRVSTPGSRWSGLGLTVQVSMATVLIVTGLLTLRSIHNLSQTDPGVDSERLLTLRLDVPAELRRLDELAPLTDVVLAALDRLPATRQASLWSPHVPGEATWYSTVRVGGRPDLQEDGSLPLVRINHIGPGAATALGLTFVAGEDFTKQDRVSGRRVALVSESAASEWWGDERAVGQQMRRWNHDAWTTVVGVVADAPLSGRQGEGSDFTRDVYFLFDQDPLRYLVFLVRLRDDDPGAAMAAQAAVREAVPDLPVYGVRFMDDILADQERIGRSSARLGGAFALAALALVAVGLYGTLAMTIARRQHEISVRKALGASATTIVRQVTVPVWSACAIGLALGLWSAWLLLPVLLGDALFGVSPQSLGFYLLAAGILLVAASPGILAPAVRGAAMSPAGALRSR
jgi:predicted permease